MSDNTSTDKGEFICLLSSSRFPYRQGTFLLLESDEPVCGPPFDDDGGIECMVVKFYQPSTLSCVMEVLIETPPGQVSLLVLKLFDHRYATRLRNHNEAKHWDISQQTIYTNFVESGDALRFLTQLQESEESEFSTEWNDAQKSVYLVHECLDMYESECDAYNQLKDLQGREIPQLIARVRCSLGLPSKDGIPSKLYDINGILLERIEGFALCDLAESAPPEDWQQICDQAIRAIRLCDDKGVLNLDVQPANVMIAPLRSENAYRAVVLDFGRSAVRCIEAQVSEEQWGRAKYQYDEEGAIGYVMQASLKELGFDLVYDPSNKYLKWAPVEQATTQEN